MSGSRKAMHAIGVTCVLTLCAGMSGGLLSQAPQKRPPALPSATTKTQPLSQQSRRNVGKAYFEQARYAEAVGEFQKVIAAGHAAATDYLNLGVALLHAVRFDDALGSLTTAKQMDPKLLAAEYNLGILLKNEQRYPDAAAALERVAAADPGDAGAWFNLGAVRLSQRKLEEAREAFGRVVAMGFARGQNFYVASLFRSFTVLSQLKRTAEAQKFLQLHEQMKGRVPEIALQGPALEGGKYGSIVVPMAPPTPPKVSAAAALTFVDVSERMGLALLPENKPKLTDRAPSFGPVVVAADYDGDGYTDLFAIIGDGNWLLHKNGNGTFEDVTEKAGVGGTGGSMDAVFADYDNSGKSSLFVAGMGGVHLYRNRGDGTFADETDKAGLALPGQELELDLSVALFDFDNDGFLDLVVGVYTYLGELVGGVDGKPPRYSYRAIRYFRNNGDGTFTEKTDEVGLKSNAGRMTKILIADFNNDGYMDLLALRDNGSPLLYLNQGDGKFADRTEDAGAALAQFVAVDGQVSDLNHDGDFDLVLWGPGGVRVLYGNGDGTFTAAVNFPAISSPTHSLPVRGATADLNGDGFDDVLAVDDKGNWHFIANLGTHFEEAKISIPLKGNSFAALAAAWLGAPGRLNLVGLTRSGKMVAFERTGPPSRWLEVKLSGAKSNTQGVGSIVEFKAGNFYNKVLAAGDRVRVFTDGLTRLDVVRVTWPNLIVQNQINVATNQRAVVRESERLASSCPLLYIWDGTKYVYYTDVLGMAPLGVLAPDGSRLPPNPQELVRLPGTMREQNGEYVIQISDELREVEFFDQVRLLAVDHPVGEEIYSDEIYSSVPQAPALFAVREKRLPVSAVDDRGRDVLPLIRELDGRYPDAFRMLRVPGLAETHTLTLDLGDVPVSATATLWLTGWVFWSDSNSARAVSSNSALQMISPYVQVRDAQGEWVTVVPDMGIPSATNRTMRVDLTGKFLSPDHHIRIVTNLCVYWDQIFLSLGDSAAPTPMAVPLLGADLHYRGFSTPASDLAHRQPDSFDYYKLLTDAPWNPLAGRYTRYGPVEDLLAKADDRLVVLATGDEMSLRFDARQLPPLRAGFARTFFLYLHGWAKDGDPNTATSRTVAPMPFGEMPQYPYGSEEIFLTSPEHQDYLRNFQTRPGHALIPPLAPLAFRPN
jgi:tetratricopeptide (TPR) repeat protein